MLTRETIVTNMISTTTDLASLRQLLETEFPDFGPNKSREVERLIFEIAKRDELKCAQILYALPNGAPFHTIKDILVRRRYHELTSKGIYIQESFPALSIKPDSAVDLKRPPSLTPRTVYVERAAASTPLEERFRKLFPASKFVLIDNYKSFTKTREHGPTDYNRRLETFFLVKEQYDFFKPCPCSNGAASCGYHNANFGFGCPFECSYCFLQSYTNAPGIVFPVNLDEFFRVFDSQPRPARVGSGETTDSLAFDHLTEFSPSIVDYFRDRPETIFEFKTKSDNIGLLLSVKAADNVVIGWSVNPQHIINREELFTASLESRVAAASLCANKGYRIAFHFDPIFYYPKWEQDYASIVSMLFDRIPANSIAWISLGTLRMTARQKKTIENRFPMNTILDGELITAADGKLRYHEKIRRNIYTRMLSLLSGRISKNTMVYLCMEPLSMTEIVD